MLSVMKDYNHNDSKLFRYLPYGLRDINLDEREQDFLNYFAETPAENIIPL